MKTYLHLWYLVEFFIERAMFQREILQQIEKHNLFKNLSPKIVLLWGIAGKYGRAGQDTDVE